MYVKKGCLLVFPDYDERSDALSSEHQYLHWAHLHEWSARDFQLVRNEQQQSDAKEDILRDKPWHVGRPEEVTKEKTSKISDLASAFSKTKK